MWAAAAAAAAAIVDARAHQPTVRGQGLRKPLLSRLSLRILAEHLYRRRRHAATAGGLCAACFDTRANERSEENERLAPTLVAGQLKLERVFSSLCLFIAAIYVATHPCRARRV